MFKPQRARSAAAVSLAAKTVNEALRQLRMEKAAQRADTPSAGGKEQHGRGSHV